jgi:hypothetical protein
LVNSDPTEESSFQACYGAQMVFVLRCGDELFVNVSFVFDGGNKKTCIANDSATTSIEQTKPG